MSVTIEFDARQVRRFFDDVHRVATKKAMPSTLNKTRDKTMTYLRKDMKSKFGIQARVINSRTKKKKATVSSQVATITMFGRTPNAIRFNPKVTKTGLSHGAFGKRKNVKGGFIGNQGRTAFKRVGDSRIPIEPIYGRNPKRAFGAEKNMNRYQRFARQEMGIIFQRQYDFFAARIRRNRR